MPDQPLKIVQISTSDLGGGAEKVALDLLHAYRKRGHDSWLAVGRKLSNEPQVLVVPNHEALSAWGRACETLRERLTPLVGRVKGVGWLRVLLRNLANVQRWRERRAGFEDFGFPGTYQLLDRLPAHPDIIHAHNLHGQYFDLRALPGLSQQIPVVLTLHDAWLLSGHCAHSFECEGWQSGCGNCPDLSIYPAITRDATAENWRRKQALYSQSRLYVATPCRWLLEKVEQSMLAPALVETRVIPYGLDLTIFQPGDKLAARRELGISPEARVFLFAAKGIRRNIWKDYQTMRAALELVGAQLDGHSVQFIGLGETAPPEQVGQARIEFVPFENQPQRIAQYYRAADVYIHAARVDTFPNAVLEALACGTPVIATAVGGIPEQIKGLGDDAWNHYGANDATGILTPLADSAAMAAAMVKLVQEAALAQQLGTNAADDARQRFDLQREAQAYLDWYRAILGRS